MKNLVFNLPQLQNLIKRDPSSYKEEFLQQYRHLNSSIAIFELKSDGDYPELCELVNFIAHVYPCYQKDASEFPDTLIRLLKEHYSIMNADLRKTMVQSLILLRNRAVLSPTTLLPLFFTLFRCQDKPLRSILHSHIVNDIKTLNAKSKNNRVNKDLQNFMYKMLQDPSELAAKKSLQVMIDLYKKNVWHDAKTVNIISEACFSTVGKLAATAIHFFVGVDEEEEEESSEDELPDLSSLRHANRINKKKKSRTQRLERAATSVKKKEKEKHANQSFNFSALHLIHDPQGFSEKLLARLKQATAKAMFPFEVRLQFMNLVTRMIGVHKLLLLGFYDFIISFLKPHQRDVAMILSYVCQASHELVPPDVMETVVRAVADNFVWSNCATEVITAGLNTLREICVRCPLAMPETLLSSLIDDYKNHRERGPMTAARSLISLYREFNPELLRKKDRGKYAAVRSSVPMEYGKTIVHQGVEGEEFLNSEDTPEQEDSDVIEIPSDFEADFDDEDLEEVVTDASDNDSDDSDEDQEDEEDDEEEEVPELVPDAKRIKTGPHISTTKILTDEDFAKIREKRMEQEVKQLAGMNVDSEFVDVGTIMAGTRKKDDYEARMESIKSGREGRTFGSKRGSETRGSLNNKEKAKKHKNFMMIVHKKDVVGKSKRSLRDKQKALRAHVTRQKRKNK